jgi:hypothetical protein
MHCPRSAPVSLGYYDKMPFKFNGTVERLRVQCVTV